jgi:5'-phosphate synthase pdxT subunit
MEVGVLALQGAFREHRKILKDCGMASREIRKPEQLAGIDGLIIPGGESTTIGKLMVEYGLMEPVREMGFEGLPIFGTCAGLVLLAKDIPGSAQPRLGLMDITVVRNGFGRQVDSFEADLEIAALGLKPFRGVFIRAPYIEKVSPNIGILASLEEKIVFARQGNFLACSFHPELTDDTRVHQYFLEMVRCGC